MTDGKPETDKEKDPVIPQQEDDTSKEEIPEQTLTPEQEEQFLIETLEKRSRRRFLNGMLLGAFLVIFGLFAVSFGPGVIRKLLGQGNPGAEVLTERDTLSKLAEIQEIIENYYLNEVDGELLEEYLFKGLAAGLDDVYADYYTAEKLSSVVDSTRGEYYGIGATIGTDADSGEFYVSEVYADSPAEEGGLQAEDLVRAVDGESVENLNLTELVTLIKSKDTFIMTIYRPET
ncbi:MAG: PDZ domain-containing protein [Lachnospiraceae bacterium]|nr:PDZ domain-containing protein [Lachnospiraceae bacterium]